MFSSSLKLPMSGSNKKAIVRRIDGSTVAGYLPLSGFTAGGEVEWLGLDGRVERTPLAEVLWIAWVRDWNLDDPANPERLNRRTFLARPRVEGLWLRLTFADGELLEGLAPLDRSLIDQVARDDGIAMLPPDARSNTQRLFVPRTAMAALELVAVITTPGKSKAARAGKDKSEKGSQSGELFPLH